MVRPRLSPAALLSQSDDRLVELARAGQDGAFAAIDARYRRPLVRYCSRLVGPDAAEDAVQQTFIQAVATLRHDERDLALRPWLYRVAHNTALKMRPRSLTDVELEEGAQPTDAGIEPALERRDEMRDVVRRVRALPDRQREALVAIALEGRGVDEVAVELDLSASAVHQLLHRARVRLRERLGALFPLGILRLLRSGGSAGTTFAGGASTGLAAAPAGQLAVGLLAAGGLALGGPAVHLEHSAQPAPRPLAHTEAAASLRPAPAAAQPLALGRTPGRGPAPARGRRLRIAAGPPAARGATPASDATLPGAQDAVRPAEDASDDDATAPVTDENAGASPDWSDGTPDTESPAVDDGAAEPAPEPAAGATDAPVADAPEPDPSQP
jgi:RNA polymerase sigma factor (sigma-70 family)